MGNVLTAPQIFQIMKKLERGREAEMKLLARLCSYSCWSKSWPSPQSSAWYKIRRMMSLTSPPRSRLLQSGPTWRPSARRGACMGWAHQQIQSLACLQSRTHFLTRFFSVAAVKAFLSCSCTLLVGAISAVMQRNGKAGRMQGWCPMGVNTDLSPESWWL